MKNLLSQEEKQAKRSKQDWRDLEQRARERLRKQFEALENNSAIDYKVSGALRNVATAAAIAKDKAYPEDAHSGLTIHIPARLLQTLAPILRSKPQALGAGESVDKHNMAAQDVIADDSTS